MKSLTKTLFLFGLFINGFLLAGPLNGTITVGPSQPVYKTFKNVADSVNANGIDANTYVEFESAGSPYSVNDSLVNFSNPNGDTLFFVSQTKTMGDVVFQASPTEADKNYVVKLKGIKNVVFGHLVFQNGSNAFGTAIFFEDTAINVVLTECSFNGTKPNAEDLNLDLIRTTNYIVMEGIHINKCNFANGNNGMFLDLTNLKTSKSVNIESNIFDGILKKAVYIQYAKALKVAGNEFRNGGLAALYLLYCDSLGVIENNYIHGAWSKGMYIHHFNNPDNGGELKIHNNSMPLLNGNGFDFGTSYGVNIYHNSLYHNSGASYLFNFNNMGNTLVKNNIFYAGPTPVFQILNDLGTMSMADNLYYSTNGLPYVLGGSSHADLTALQNNSSYGTNSIEFDPKFHSTSTLELSCKSGNNTRAISNVGVSVDFEGQSRDLNTPYRGADEFYPSKKDSILIGGTVAVNGDTLKSGMVYLFSDTSSKALHDTIGSAVIQAADGAYLLPKVWGFSFRLLIVPGQSETQYVKGYHDQNREWEKVSSVEPNSCAFLFNPQPLKLKPLATGNKIIKGAIFDNKTGKSTNPIPGLDVVLDKIPPQEGEAVAKTITDQNGEYTFANLPEGTFKVIIDYPGISKDVVHEVELKQNDSLVTNLDYCVDTSQAISDCSDANFVEYVIKENVSFYPNPTSGQFNISTKGGQLGTIRIYNIQGVLVEEIFSANAFETLELEHLPTGNYVLSLQANKHQEVLKFTKK